MLISASFICTKRVLIYNSTDDYTFCDYFKTQGSASDTTE